MSNSIPATRIYVDMNSFFASCEQQQREELRGKPIGVVTHSGNYACVIAPSIEAKRLGVKTGMRLSDCRLLCPSLIPVVARPFIYRQYHLKIMDVLRHYCIETVPKSIDEAVMDMTSYRLVYPCLKTVAQNIKVSLSETCGSYVKCSIGIAPNTFLAKLATELQKPDGLVELTPENLDEHLARMQLTDLPGIARANEKRLMAVGIYTPLQLRHSSESLLRKVFGGIVGNYWYQRLHFMEVDGSSTQPYQSMSTARTVSGKQRESLALLESLFVSLCTRLEQRMVKQEVFCKEIRFFIRYTNIPAWETRIVLNDYTQDAVEIRQYIQYQMACFEQAHSFRLFNNRVQQMGVTVSSFLHGKRCQYNLFDNKINKDKVRAVMYALKDRYRRDIVRRASEIMNPHEMRDAIGFGSVKDLGDKDGSPINEYLLEDDELPLI